MIRVFRRCANSQKRSAFRWLNCSRKTRKAGRKNRPAELRCASPNYVARANCVAKPGKSDRIRKDEHRNLIICPLPYDGAFMQVFYYSWNIVQQFIQSDAKMPREVNLPTPSHRQVAGELVQRI